MHSSQIILGILKSCLIFTIPLTSAEQQWEWFPPFNRRSEIKANNGLPSSIYWRLDLISSLPKIGKNIQYTPFDLCTTHWEDYFQLEHSDAEGKGNFERPFGYHRWRVVSCKDGYSVRLVNWNKLKTVGDEGGGMVPAPEKEWKRSARVFCHEVLNITERIYESMEMSSRTIDSTWYKYNGGRNGLSEEETQELWDRGKDLPYYNATEVPPESVVNPDFELIAKGWRSEDPTWFTILGKELEGCPEESSKKEWVEVTDSRTLPEFHPVLGPLINIFHPPKS